MAWTFVQKSEFSDNTGALSISAPSATYTAGNLLVVMVSAGGASGTQTFTPTDSQGSPNTYTQIQATMRDATNDQDFAVWYAKNIGGATYTVTVNLGQSVGSRRIVVLEYSGLDTSAPLNTSAKTAEPATSGASNTATCAAVTTAVANELIVVGGMDTSTSPTNLSNGTGYIQRSALAASEGMIAEDKNLASATTETPTYTLDTGASFLAITAAFKEAGGASLTTEYVAPMVGQTASAMIGRRYV